MTGKRLASLLALAGRCARELLQPATLALFTLAGALLATLPGAAWGGAGLTLWGLGGLAVAAALAGGLGGAFGPGGLYHSPWLQARPPGRARRSLAGALGTWAGLGVLLLPSLLLPLFPWRWNVGELRLPVPLTMGRFHPGPSELLASPGATAEFRPSGKGAVARILLEPLLAPSPSLDLRPTSLALSLDGEPFQEVGLVLPPGSTLEFRLDPPRSFQEGVLRRGPEPGAGLWFYPGALRLLGAARPPEVVWLCLWLSAWNLATAGALTMAAGGALLSRPAALCLGAGWAFLALADPVFRGGLPPGGPARGEACGLDLEGGLGWLVLAWAGLCTGLLAWRGGREPDREGR